MRHPVSFPKHYKPLPVGYEVVQLDSGHYQWINESIDQAGPKHVDAIWVRKCAIAHAERRAREAAEAPHLAGGAA